MPCDGCVLPNLSACLFLPFPWTAFVLGRTCAAGVCATPPSAVPDQWVDFFKDLKECKNDAGAEQFFRGIDVAVLDEMESVLDVKIGILGEAVRGSKIYLRRCDRQIIPELLAEYPAKRRYLISGTPGAGETVFGLFLLHWCSRRRYPALYQYSPSGNEMEKDSFVLFRGKAYTLTAAQVSKALQLPVVYICDSLTPANARHGLSATIIITSSTLNRYTEYEKQVSVPKRCMPLWALDELQQCNACCGWGTPDAMLNARYARWGGVARQVLQNARESDEDDLRYWESAIEESKAATAFSAIANMEKAECHRTLHMEVPRGEDGGWLLKLFVPVFTSLPIAKRMRAKLYADDAIAAMRVVHRAQNAPQFRGLAAYMFEPMVLHRFAAGGTSSLRALAQPRASTGGTAAVSAGSSSSASATDGSAAPSSSHSWTLVLPPASQEWYNGASQLTAFLGGRGRTESLALLPTGASGPAVVDFVITRPQEAPSGSVTGPWHVNVRPRCIRSLPARRFTAASCIRRPGHPGFWLSVADSAHQRQEGVERMFDA